MSLTLPVRANKQCSSFVFFWTYVWTSLIFFQTGNFQMWKYSSSSQHFLAVNFLFWYTPTLRFFSFKHSFPSVIIAPYDTCLSNKWTLVCYLGALLVPANCSFGSQSSQLADDDDWFAPFTSWLPSATSAIIIFCNWHFQQHNHKYIHNNFFPLFFSNIVKHTHSWMQKMSVNNSFVEKSFFQMKQSFIFSLLPLIS